jgi:glucose/arabinose dehydrogenase
VNKLAEQLQINSIVQAIRPRTGRTNKQKQRKNHMNQLLAAGLLVALTAAQANAQINAGKQQPEPSLPFTVTKVATFNLPWRIAFLPDGRMLITEKVGALWLVT